MKQLKALGRYLLSDAIAAGGMATVHLGRLMGEAGFSRTVAIKRMHPHLSRDPEFVRMFVDEARLASRIRNPNVVSTLDVVESGEELFLVMEYVEGESLLRLLSSTRTAEERVPLPIVSAIICGVLAGLAAAHEAKSEQGQFLGMVHRDISPHNVLVGVDGVARVVDFGVAKAAGRLQATGDSQLKGKLGYMAPEQIGGEEVDRRVDVYAAAVVLWEMIVGHALFAGKHAALALQLVEQPADPPSLHVEGVSAALDAVVLKGLSTDPAGRYPTAAEMAEALEEAVPIASPRQVGDWVKQMAKSALADRAGLLDEVERATPVEVTGPASRSLLVEGSSLPTRWPTLAPRARGSWIFAAAAVAGGLIAFAALGGARWGGTSEDAARSPIGGPGPESEAARPASSESLAVEAVQAPPTEMPAGEPTVTPSSPSKVVPLGSASMVKQGKPAPVAPKASDASGASAATPPPPPKEKDYGF